jgi:hypothetical protein
MWAAIKGIFGAVFGAATSQAGGSSILGKAMDIASEKVVDQDKLIAILGTIVQQQIQAENNPGWVPAIAVIGQAPVSVQRAVALYIWGDVFHKMARTILWLMVLVVYVLQSYLTKQPMDLETLMLLAAGPALYTVMKGQGRK